MKNLVFACAAFALSAHLSYGQINPVLEKGLQDILDTNISMSNLKGVEATLILPSGARWTGVSGVSDPSSTPVDTIRKWHWGSVTKAMIASIVLQLDDQALLDINDSIGMYLDADTIPYLDGQTTIKMLLNHTTDLNNSWTNGSNLWNDVWADRDSVWNISDVLDSSYRSAGTPNPGLVHSYNGYDNYLILGFMIEAVTGQSLDVEFTNRIFTALGFTNSAMGTNGVNMNDLNGLYDGSSYRGNLSHNSYMSTRGAGGTYLGSSNDVSTFIRAFHNDQLVSSSLMNEARISTNGTPISIPGTCFGILNQTYGYGTNIVHYVDAQNDTVSFYGHGGNGLGNSLAFHTIDSNVTISVITNDLSFSAQQSNLALFMDLICYVWDNWQLVDWNLSSVEQQVVKFSVYPNPAKSILKIRSEETPDKLIVTDMQGKVCLESERADEINIADLDKGVYLLKLYFENSVVTKVWVKE